MKKFVVHYHVTKKPHYDLRLELANTLKSWSILRGISMDPTDKRFATLIADCDLTHLNFEGMVYESKYGNGNVTIWDTGEYYSTTKDERETFNNGVMTIRFKGKILNGIWRLYKFRKGGEDSWLIRKKDV